ncbi:caspase, EACC1-associated type [Micromonosporaceae bacterium Da 78-11]
MLPDPDRPDPDRPDPDRPDPDRPSPDRPSPDRPSPDRPSPDLPGLDLPGPDRSGRRHALVVATSTYTDPDLEGLRAPVRDADDMIEVLGDPQLGGFTVTPVINEPEHDIRYRIEDFLAQRRPGDLALVYLSCHGVLNSRDQLHFAAVNTRRNRLGATAIAAAWLHDRLEECDARRQVLILDCCFSGAFAGTKAAADLDLERRLLGAGRGRDLLTASRGSEYSFEGEPLPGGEGARSMFTAALVDGIRSGAADVNNDGLISVEDAFHHAADTLKAAGAQQNPQYFRSRGEGKIVIARNPHRVPTAPVEGRVPLSWPHRVGVMPRPAVGRQLRPAADVLAAAVGGNGTAVAGQVLTGMAGIGKTQLAAQVAEQLWQTRQLDLLIWVTAASRAGVLATYAQAAKDIFGFEDRDPWQAASRLLAWLAGTDRAWLIVLDDLAEPADLITLWPPESPVGRTLVTTRRRDTALLAGRQQVDVAAFTPGEALDYLTGRLDDAASRLDQAGPLAADLGHLPLALAQAAAYIVDQDLTCAAYRDRLTRYRLDRLRPRTLPDDQATPVALTWALSVQAVDADTGGLAGLLLQIAALLDPDGIPLGVFTTRAAIGYYQRCLEQDVDADDVHDGIRALHRLNLADTTGTGTGTGDVVLRVHALVQRVIRETTPHHQQHRLAVTVGDALIELWPALERDRATTLLGQRLRANTTVLTTLTGTHLWHDLAGEKAAHLVLLRGGRRIAEIGLFGTAHEHYERLQASAIGQLGPDHRDTWRTRHAPAHWRGRKGDPAGAAAAFEQLLADGLRVLGPDHRDILDTRHSLAYWRGKAGDPTGAAAAFGQLLDDRVKMLGPDHLDTLDTRYELADWQGNAGHPDHPDTLTVRRNLAVWRGRAAGDPAGVAAAFEELLADYLRALGPGHPDTVDTRHSLAYWRGKAGDPAGAAAAFEQLLDAQVKMLGPDHLTTLHTRLVLLVWQGQAGDTAGATAAIRPLMADYDRVFGRDASGTPNARLDGSDDGPWLAFFTGAVLGR